MVVSITKENINNIITNIFFNFRKTLLVQFSRDMSDKLICKYDIAVCLKKVSFYCIMTVCFISVIFFKQLCRTNILTCCVNENFVQVVHVCPLNRATSMCQGSCMQFSVSCCLLAMSTTQIWCCWPGCLVVKCATAYGNN